MAVVNCDAIPGSFARVVGKLGTSLTNRAHRENFRWYFVKKWCFVKMTKYSTYLHKDYNYFCKYNFNELMKNLKLTGKF
jgi:hypothetical protein